MKILVINCGSSSVRYRLFDMRDETVLAGGLVERIGERESRFAYSWRNDRGREQTLIRNEPLSDHRSAFRSVVSALREPASAPVFAELSGIGHRVVHGGETFRGPVPIDNETVESIRGLCALAPLHNPADLAGIEMFLEAFPQVPQVAVFDTAFHQTMPPQAYRYAVPEPWYREHRVRRYGFHGTSHAYVARRAAEYLRQPGASLNLITLHLGNGASAAAIREGRCVDTSMGFTPLEGLIMGTRSGDIDPAILFYIGKLTGAGMDELESTLNRDSGLRGLCGVNDMREIQALADAGDDSARLAIEMYVYRIRKYIGAYFAVLGRVDALVFTAGIGENSSFIRKQVCDGLGCLGISLDDDKNNACRRPACEIQTDAGVVKVLVVPTDEELEIAKQTMACIGSGT